MLESDRAYQIHLHNNEFCPWIAIPSFLIFSTLLLYNGLILIIFSLSLSLSILLYLFRYITRICDFLARLLHHHGSSWWTMKWSCCIINQILFSDTSIAVVMWSDLCRICQKDKIWLIKSFDIVSQMEVSLIYKSADVVLTYYFCMNISILFLIFLFLS